MSTEQPGKPVLTEVTNEGITLAKYPDKLLSLKELRATTKNDLGKFAVDTSNAALYAISDDNRKAILPHSDLLTALGIQNDADYLAKKRAEAAKPNVEVND